MSQCRNLKPHKQHTWTPDPVFRYRLSECPGVRPEGGVVSATDDAREELRKLQLEVEDLRAVTERVVHAALGLIRKTSMYGYLDKDSELTDTN